MLIGLTIVAFGTSAPEFAVSMSALASNSSDMVLGNVIGSNILNILLILGLTAIINPIKIKSATVKKELPLTLLISILLAVLMLDTKLAGATVNMLTRADAIVILLFFTVFIYYLITLAKKGSKENEEPKFKLGKSILFIFIGLVAIIIGSDLVVDSASSIAKAIGLSERIISLTIIAFGTSLPELVTSVVSSKKGESDLAIGNIIGSNIFNVGVVLGIPILIYGTIIPSNFQGIDLIMLVGTAALLFILSTTKRTISRLEGVLMLIVFAVYYTLLFII